MWHSAVFIIRASPLPSHFVKAGLRSALFLQQRWTPRCAPVSLWGPYSTGYGSTWKAAFTRVCSCILFDRTRAKQQQSSLYLISACLQILHQWPLTLTLPILICPCPSRAPRCGLRRIRTRRIASPTHGASITITVCLAVRASPQGDTTGRWRWGIRQHGGWEWHKMTFQEVRPLLLAPPVATGPWPWRADLSSPAPTRSPPRSPYLSVLPASVCS